MFRPEAAVTLEQYVNSRTTRGELVAKEVLIPKDATPAGQSPRLRMTFKVYYLSLFASAIVRVFVIRISQRLHCPNGLGASHLQPGMTHAECENGRKDTWRPSMRHRTRFRAQHLDRL